MIHVAWDGKDVVNLVSSLFHWCMLIIYIQSAFCHVLLQLSKCDVCQRMNRKLNTGVPELHSIPVKAPWYMVGIDFVGPLSPIAKDESWYILTISDYFTREAIPTVDERASTVASSLFKVSKCTCRIIYSFNRV